MLTISNTFLFRFFDKNIRKDMANLPVFIAYHWIKSWISFPTFEMSLIKDFTIYCISNRSGCTYRMPQLVFHWSIFNQSSSNLKYVRKNSHPCVISSLKTLFFSASLVTQNLGTLQLHWALLPSRHLHSRLSSSQSSPGLLLIVTDD